MENADWESIASSRSVIDASLFSRGDYINSPSSISEFWDFFQRFHTAKSKRPKRAADGETTSYNPKHRINFEIIPKRKPAPEDAAVLREAQYALHFFEDFNQRKRLQKAVDIGAAQLALPIADSRDAIIRMLVASNVLVVAGDTGCGKSTQLPQYVQLHSLVTTLGISNAIPPPLMYLIACGVQRVACTQPRRISAISLCRRVASEMLQQVGDSVGYQIRFDSSRSQSTRVLFMTEGLLLRQMQADPMLSDYSCIVLDEVHERHLTMDLLLAILRALLRVRSDLHLVLMSATANVQMFAQYFTAPICTVPGRCYPVQVQYHPPPDELHLEPKPITRVAGVIVPPQRRRRVEFNCGPYLKLLSHLEQKYPWDERGDVLVFLPGINEICALQAALAERAQQSSSSRWIVLPLHSTVSADEQDKVFDLSPDGSRKIILATNIAETSITIDGIRFVVDSGRAKDMVYDEITRTHSLKECTICKASAEQRKGRAGRTGPGVCFRIYSERVYEEMPEFPVPEIHKAPLESLALSIKNMKLGDPRRFPFVDPPPLHRMDAAMLRLRDMGCLRGSGEDLTALGSVLAALPVDVGVGKMLVLGTLFDLADECLTLAAALATQSPLLRVEEGSSCLQMRRELLSDDEINAIHHASFSMLLIPSIMYDEWIAIKAARSESSKKWCKRYGIEEQRLYELTKLKSQFTELLQDAGLLPRGVEAPRPALTQRMREQKAEIKRLIRDKETKKRRRVLSTADAPALVDGGADAPEEQDLISQFFELSNDLSAMSRKCRRDLSLIDVSVLKLILSAGMYPNVAVADEANGRRPESDATFHTPTVQNVAAHPTCIFGAQPSLITGSVIAAFGTLLDTVQPYFTNAIRVPCVPALLLFCSCIDTDSCCRTILIDRWLRLEVEGDDEHRMSMLCTAVKLRKLLDSALDFQLSAIASHDYGADAHCTNEEQALPPLLSQARQFANGTGVPPPGQVKSQLSVSLAAFLELGTGNSKVQPLAKHEAAWMLLHPSLSNDALSLAQLQEAAVAVHEVVEEKVQIRSIQANFGVAVTPYFRFGSCSANVPVESMFSRHTERPFRCAHCGLSQLLSLDRLLEHQATCLSAAKK